MTKSYPNQRTARVRQALPPSFDFTPNRTAVAVRNALLFGLAFSALAVVTPPALAQTSNAATDLSEEQAIPLGTEGVTTLPTVTVTGESTMPTYSGGQVSTGGRMGLLGEKDFMETPFSTITYTEKYIKATDRLSVYANYIEGLSQGATAPNTAENAGEVFAPYKTKQKEVGIKFDLGEFAHTLSVYEIKRPSSYTDPFTNIFSFGGEQRNRGVEWGFFGSPMRGVRLMGGIAYSDAEVTKAAVAANEGKQATGLPKWQAKLGTEWDVPAMQGLTLTANATWADKQYLSADNSLSIPGRTVFDVGARYATRVSGRPLTLRAAVTNVTNKAYWAKPHFTSLGLGAPRTFLLSATMDF